MVQSFQSCKETNCVSFSPNGAQLAAGNDLCQVQLWDVEQIKVRPRLLAQRTCNGSTFEFRGELPVC